MRNERDERHHRDGTGARPTLGVGGIAMVGVAAGPCQVPG